MTVAPEAKAPGVIRSLIPARIDRLPWSPFHTRMVVALGVAWILDGLEITVASAAAAQLTSEDTLALATWQVTLMATVYLAARWSEPSSSAVWRTGSAAGSCSSSPWPCT
jgi:hypothetical protein